jgi:hypothetical protein
MLNTYFCNPSAYAKACASQKLRRQRTANKSKVTQLSIGLQFIAG